MKHFFPLVLGILIAGAASAETRYILRYTESEPLRQFLARHGLVREATVAGKPIHSVVDPQDRNASSLLGQIASESDGDVSMELDQILELPIRSFRTRQTSGFRRLLASMSNTWPVAFYGAQVPAGVLNQDALSQVRARESWRDHGPGAGLAAVIDTGVDSAHPFFAGRVVKGYDFVTRGGNGSELNGLPADMLALINPTTTPLLLREPTYVSEGTAPFFEQDRLGALRLNSLPIGLGHGTMVAGAIRLMAPGARILPIRAFEQNGLGRLFHVIQGLHAAASRGATVVNLSFNTAVYSPELDRSSQELSDRGIILAASTGNDGVTNPVSYPAQLDKVTGVAAVNRFDVRSLFSNAGPRVTWVAAPGEALLLPYPGSRWAGGWGTSFAAPLVSGLALKIGAAKPNSTYSELQSALGKSQPLPDPNLGLGRLDVWNSVAGL